MGISKPKLFANLLFKKPDILVSKVLLLQRLQCILTPTVPIRKVELNYGKPKRTKVGRDLYAIFELHIRYSMTSLYHAKELVQVIDTDGDALPQVQPSLFENEVSREISLRRSNILKEMIAHFSDPGMLNCNLNFVLLADNNEPEMGRGNGVACEVLSLFWREFSISLAIGAAEKVPSIRHNYQRDKWSSIARIIVFAFRKERYFPIFLSKSFVASCVYREDILTKECLLDSFSAYVSKDEQDIMKKCLNSEIDVEDEDVMDLLSSYNCYRKPSKDSIDNILKVLAHQELVQRPKYISTAWNEQLKVLKTFP